jgi:hypothetical protein
MSQENVEIVRRAWETVNSGDSDVDDWLGGYVDVWLDEFFDPEIEWHDVPTLPEAGVHLRTRGLPSPSPRLHGGLGRFELRGRGHKSRGRSRRCARSVRRRGEA